MALVYHPAALTYLLDATSQAHVVQEAPVSVSTSQRDISPNTLEILSLQSRSLGSRYAIRDDYSSNQVLEGIGISSGRVNLPQDNLTNPVYNPGFLPHGGRGDWSNNLRKGDPRLRKNPMAPHVLC